VRVWPAALEVDQALYHRLATAAAHAGAAHCRDALDGVRSTADGFTNFTVCHQVAVANEQWAPPGELDLEASLLKVIVNIR
jgi:hypothetical protein